MASIGKFVFGLASGEASLSLANINFDFAVVKMEPPKELLGLGNSLSKKRKFEAEEGSIHATARRLGALFAEILPNTPNLARVYGIRASEIASNPEFNPAGKDSDGPLARHIGADGTSIWAAATSSRGALQAHLLACMLARVWSRPEAISIWSELVSVRKRTLREELQASEFNINTVTACQIEIRRDELAEWDASARSWLITADKAKTLQQTQLMLIIDNIGLKMPSRPEVYENVMSVWTKAMSTVDSLVSGVGQSVQSPEVFLGLSAWHLYPDMSVLGAQTTYIDQKDDVIVKGGHITIGLHSKDENGVSWSMPLACLRYYGKPVISEGSLSSKSMRVPFRRLVQIAIGGAISRWNENAFNIDEVCTFFELLSVRIDPREGSSTGLPKTWMAMFGREASHCLQETEAHRKESFRYISLGRRRYGSLLSKDHPPPLLGLEGLVTFLGLLDVEKQIAAIREISITYRLTQNMKGVNLNGAIIRYFPGDSSSAEFASLMPQSIPQTSRKLHRRWVVKVDSLDNKFPESLPVLRSLKIMHSTGEPCGFLGENDIQIQQTDARDDSSRFLYWKSGNPSIDLNYLHERSGLDDTGLPVDKRILGWSIGATSHHYGNMKYRFSFGSSKVQVYVPVNEWKNFSFKLDLKFIAQALRSEVIDGSTVLEYLADTADTAPNRVKNRVFLCDWAHDYLMSLNALYLASLIYHGIPNADINLSILSMELHEAKWAMSWNNNFDGSLANISRAQSFACIAMFESGSLNIGLEDFEEVIAISSGNSLYVSEYLLCDPFTPPPESKLRCLVGNIGKPGLAMLLSARDPDVREPDLETWEMINHNSFDGRSEDNFKSTSLQLHLTGYEMPLNVQSHGVRDNEAFYVEAVVSVYDQGVWVADIDVLSLYQARSFSETGPAIYNRLDPGSLLRGLFQNILLPPRCPHVRADGDNFSRFDPITSVDCWSEFLDLPQNLAVIRARHNWVARLALATVMAKKEKGMMVAGETVCWTCVEVLMISRGLNASEVRVLC